ncbi:MAG: response regulator [Anaerolineae bacterium]|nr:response regulator [Anaerolineae bacterium]
MTKWTGETGKARFVILVVEDDDDLGEAITFVLKEAGFETELIRDGINAMQWIREQVPDLVLLDMHLPGISGLEILDRVRSDARFAKVRVMVTTADLMAAKAAEGKADVIFTKPYSVTDLLDSVAKFSP